MDQRPAPDSIRGRRCRSYSSFAHKLEAVLVLPDWSARRVKSSWFDFGGDETPPGNAIYVPHDISGVDRHRIAVETTAVSSRLATAATSLATRAIVTK